MVRNTNVDRRVVKYNSTNSSACSAPQLPNPTSLLQPSPTGRHEPTVRDILVVRCYFLLCKPPLPYELVDIILDEVCYWAHSTVTVKYPACADSWYSPDHMYMRTLPLAIPGTEGDFVFSPQEPKEIRLGAGLERSNLSLYHRLHPCRRIVFELWSHDQGWSSNPSRLHGTYREAFSWWDASAEAPQPVITGNTDTSWPSLLVFTDAKRLEAAQDVEPPVQFYQNEQTRPSIPNDKLLQRNLHAVYKTSHHTVKWSHTDEAVSAEDQHALEDLGRGRLSGDGSFVRNLKVGDCIVLWASARFPGWQMYAEKAKISVYWAV
ncbi:hypothetical protein BKA82DRAFT_1001610 [Pisolithus tinctorius]|nr:hypothetical protein BKA82DRAFT_1001610 [Pisolithus tinctorius]